MQHIRKALAAIQYFELPCSTVVSVEFCYILFEYLDRGLFAIDLSESVATTFVGVDSLDELARVLLKQEDEEFSRIAVDDFYQLLPLLSVDLAWETNVCDRIDHQFLIGLFRERLFSFLGLDFRLVGKFVDAPFSRLSRRSFIEDRP